LSRLALPALAAAALAAGLSGCATASGATPGGAAEPGRTGAARSFVATDLNGDEFDFGVHLGRDVVLLSFWATYCEPCKAEMPVLQKLHDTYGGQGLKIVSVSLDGSDTQAGVRPYIRTQGYTFQVVIDEDTAIANAYNPRATAPFTVLFGRDGKIHKQIAGFQLSEAAELEATVKALVAAP
jgi:thiol-disulfide isomerase/thioredoxin